MFPSVLVSIVLCVFSVEEVGDSLFFFFVSLTLGAINTH